MIFDKYKNSYIFNVYSIIGLVEFCCSIQVMYDLGFIIFALTLLFVLNILLFLFFLLGIFLENKCSWEISSNLILNNKIINIFRNMGIILFLFPIIYMLLAGIYNLFGIFLETYFGIDIGPQVILNYLGII